LFIDTGCIFVLYLGDFRIPEFINHVYQYSFVLL